jgi:hypothetical protein
MAGSNAPSDGSTRDIKLRIYTRYEKHKVHARVHVVGETHAASGAKVELALISQRTGEVQERKSVRKIGQEIVTFRTNDIPSGCCVFEATFIDRSGSRFNTEILYDRMPDSTEWFGCTTGVSRKVPKPWTPVKIKKKSQELEIGCWGRTYSFTGASFVDQIFAKGVPLLAGPVRPIATINGKNTRWTTGRQRVLQADKDQVIFSRAFRNKSGVSITTRAEFDFDGVVRIDWGISSDTVVSLDALSIEIPIRKDIAKYLYHFPGQWGGVRNVGALPKRDIRLGFRPFVWLGDEERGLSWFCETDRNWISKDPGKVTEIRHESESVILRINLVSKPVNLVPGKQSGKDFTGFGEDSKPPAPGGQIRDLLKFSFGLQATPVKPVETDAWDHRIICIGQASKGFRSRLNISGRALDKLVKAGVRTVVLFEHWADAEGYPGSPHSKAAKKFVNACHDRGLKVLFYFGFLISDIAPEWETFGKDSLILPKGGYPLFLYDPQPGQSAWRVCLNSAWQDLVADGMAKTVEEYDLDGVYLDGTEYPFGCCNTEHGCGHVRADGTVAPTYPIFGVRSAMRRIYHAVRSRKPDGYVNVHNSTCMTMPTLGWATSYWDGEQFQNTGKGVDVAQLLPLDAFRAEFMGHQWGVPAEFLYAGKAYTFEQSWSFALLHDIPVRPLPHFYADEEDHADEDLALTSAIWNVMDRFGRKKADWMPYWKNEDYVSVRPAGCHVSLYRHPVNGILAVVSNQSGKSKSVTVQFDYKRLGIKSAKEITDAMSGAEIPLQNGRIKLDLDYLGWNLVWIR